MKMIFDTWKKRQQGLSDLRLKVKRTVYYAAIGARKKDARLSYNEEFLFKDNLVKQCSYGLTFESPFAGEVAIPNDELVSQERITAYDGEESKIFTKLVEGSEVLISSGFIYREKRFLESMSLDYIPPFNFFRPFDHDLGRFGDQGQWQTDKNQAFLKGRECLRIGNPNNPGTVFWIDKALNYLIVHVTKDLLMDLPCMQLTLTIRRTERSATCSKSGRPYF